MPDRVNNLEKQRSQTHLSQRSLFQSLLLSNDSQSLSKIPSLSNMSDLSTSSSSSSSSSSGHDRHNMLWHTTHSWIMNDDDRIDRFSDNYYRAHWGLHKGGLVLGVFLGLIGVISVVVGMAYVG
eukprot:CAMPEP_0201720996 /NCGR_PEP_ID=MMETSP0593-20130828/5810_1 /ASSEMBLY_ACC=CAM_ASM_000672 /TAXON_ID=267983 /ORGANISM="Skeletonema japonicum, Strain CCMP2506" /LENGTH=123 /DNA_ID=CAMNT_0048211739 /DNA_START=135 /DNA_END=506 /DNA_ORIENTATION=-